LDRNLIMPGNSRFARPTVALFVFLTGLEFALAGAGVVDLLAGHWSQGAALISVSAAGFLGLLVAASR
jgi:hypothetical protein